MPEQLLKLSPHRDLACYPFQPSAIAALSSASETGFTLSGSWRQQWDWAVVEWNRDNVFDHPSLRYLPDLGTNDLSGLTLSYVEQRSGCVFLESNTYPTVEWPYLRFWVPKSDGSDDVYFVRISDYATPVTGATYQNATVTMTLSGTATPGLRTGLAFMGTFGGPVVEQDYWYQTQTGDTLATVAQGVADAINAGSPDIEAVASGVDVICTYRGVGTSRDKTGANANRIGVYGFVQSGSGITWAQPSNTFSSGQFPSHYQVTLEFNNLHGVLNDPTLFFTADPLVAVPTSNVRKLRWTWAADLQPASYERTEFQIVVSEWEVTGSGRTYFIAGPGSRRIEENDPGITYEDTSEWELQPPGNYFGGHVQKSSSAGSSCTIQYAESLAHSLYLGTRRLNGAAAISLSIDGSAPLAINLALPGEDIMARIPLGIVGAGSHTIVITHSGPEGAPFYFDFLEIAYPTNNLPDFNPFPQLALATDWDTLHSQALAPERTAWIISKLGFKGRVNHYVGAIWFYELVRPGQQYAAITASISVPAGGPTGYTEIDFGPTGSITAIQHLNLPHDTPQTIAEALALRINQGTTAVWASASGNVLTITSRFMGNEGNGLAVSAYPAVGNVSVTFSAAALSGGVDGEDVGFDGSDPNAASLQALTAFWRTDLSYPPAINRACRDWSEAFYRALASYGIDCVAAFSTELAHVDPRPSAGMAQRYADGSPVVLNTPAIQTNFSPDSVSFWQAVYLTMAGLQAAAGVVPYLQSGEVQWWYFPKPGVGLPYYDEYTKAQFASLYGGSLPATILTSDTDPAAFPHESQLFRTLLGNFTAALRSALQSTYPDARYEILYPGDVNQPVFNTAVNLATEDWTPANLTCFKTEGLGYASLRNLDLSLICMRIGAALDFPLGQRSHLAGISDSKTSWMKEVDLAQAEGLESVVLFALDQYCLIGYPAPPFLKQRWSRRAA